MKAFNLLASAFLATVLFAGPVQADKHQHKDMDHKKMDHKDHKDHDHSDAKATGKKIGKDKLLIKVKGMVCAFCAQGVEKNFNAREEVKNTKVDLDTMEVTVTFKKGKSLSQDVVKEIVTGAGFQYAGIIE